jgi:hypothetical protein
MSDSEKKPAETASKKSTLSTALSSGSGSKDESSFESEAANARSSSENDDEEDSVISVDQPKKSDVPHQSVSIKQTSNPEEDKLRNEHISNCNKYLRHLTSCKRKTTNDRVLDAKIAVVQSLQILLTTEPSFDEFNETLTSVKKTLSKDRSPAALAFVKHVLDKITFGLCKKTLRPKGALFFEKMSKKCDLQYEENKAKARLASAESISLTFPH